MFEALFETLAKLGGAEVQNVLVSICDSALTKYHDFYAWKKILARTGDFYLQNENEADPFFNDLSLALSHENIEKIAKDLKDNDGYDLQQKLEKAFMAVMAKYEIPHETAEAYTHNIIKTVLEQLRIIDPQKYEHFFLQEWRDEENTKWQLLEERIAAIKVDIDVFFKEQIHSVSAGDVDVDLRSKTHNPIIGIDFFVIDDDQFQKCFVSQKSDELVFIRGRNREETVYCIINELWRLHDKRPIFVVNDLESWNKLRTMGKRGNVFIPLFYADEIAAIEGNTNIFALDENSPSFNKNVLLLRPRTYETLANCLREAGMNSNTVSNFLSDTHGLFEQMKKKLFKGEYQKEPSWVRGMSKRAQKTCLLIGSWEDCEGDKLIIEKLYDDSYEKFLDEVRPYAKGGDSLLHVVKVCGSVSYSLASAENAWCYLDVGVDESIWGLFIESFLDVINESENLFTYGIDEKLSAQIKGEKLFWSETIRKGMLKTLLIKGVLHKDDETQNTINQLVEQILKEVKTEKQWVYIAQFWRELSEISPDITLRRLENEFSVDTGLFQLFKNHSNDSLLERNDYVNIIRGVEQFLCQKEYFWRAFRWLLKLDSFQYGFKMNSLDNTFTKILCTWHNYSYLSKAAEKIKAAEIAFSIDPENAWEYLYSAIFNDHPIIIGELSTPRYREHDSVRETSGYEMETANQGYFSLLLNHMNSSALRWEKMIDGSTRLPEQLVKAVLDQLRRDLCQMSDEELMTIKNQIRHQIYMHRFYSSAKWAISEKSIVEYESLLNSIEINTPEYEYCYLFLEHDTYQLLNPIPDMSEGENDKNEKSIQRLIQDSLTEFQNKKYKLSVLAKVCALQSYSTLGKYLAKYWNNGVWDYSVFEDLLTAQESGYLACDYLGCLADWEKIPYGIVIEDLINRGCSAELLAKVYRSEASRTKVVPLIEYASEQIKKEFWKNYILLDDSNSNWALVECKKYAPLEVYWKQIYNSHIRYKLTAEQILKCFNGVERMIVPGGLPYSFHLGQLLGVIQESFIGNEDKCSQIARLEFTFSNWLDWKDMKCFRQMISQSPDVFAEMIDVVFKKDHYTEDRSPEENEYRNFILKNYLKAHFCPAECDGYVNVYHLEQWVEKFKNLLVGTDHESLFTKTLGRLFAYSPIGKDGVAPCESVRKMIEKYGDEEMSKSYQIEVFNQRGVFSFSGGKNEQEIAENFKKKAETLAQDYPKTASMLYEISASYKNESKWYRLEAENGF